MGRITSRYAALIVAIVAYTTVAQSPQTTAPSPAVPAPATAPVAKPPAKPTLPALPDPPADPTTPNVTRYLNNPDLLKFTTSQVASFISRDADIIFIGDSITQNWFGAGKAIWDANFAARNALDFGIGGDQTQ